MKLFTICDKSESKLNLNGDLGVKLMEYSYEDYLNFLNQSKKYFVYESHDWYETDMSDSDSGSRNRKFSINYNNMIVKDNELYGVLVKTSQIFPSYYILTLKEKRYFIELEGGYNSNSYSWKLVEYDNINNIDILLSYILIVEKIIIEEKAGKTKIIYYDREIKNLMPQYLIYKDDKVIGIDLYFHNFINH